MNAIRKGGIEFFAVTVAFCLAAAVFFRGVLFRPDRVFPWDFVDNGYPEYFFVDRWLHRGIFPAWNPHIAFGVPLAGQMGSQLFYLPTYIQSLFGNPLSIRAPEAMLVAHIVLAAIGMYYLCRTLSLTPMAAAIAGVIFAFGGFFPNKVQHPTWVHTAAWMPLAVLALEKFTTHRRIRYVAYLALILLMMLLAGFWQQTMYSMYFLLAWASWRAITLIRERIAFRSALAPVLAVLIACGGALLCASCELIPSFETATDSVRQTLTLGDSAQGSLGGINFLTMLFPGLFAGASGDSFLLKLGDPSLLYSYCGTIVLLLLIYAATMGKRGAPNRRALLWTFLVTSLILAVGISTPLYGLCFKLIPGFAFFRRPLSFYFFAVFAASILAAYAVDDLLAEVRIGKEQLVRQLISVVVCGAVLLAIFAHAGRPVVASIFAPLEQDRAGQFTDLIARALFANAILLGIGGVLMWTLTRYRANARFFAGALVIVCFAELYFFNADRVFDSAKLNVNTLATSTTLLGDPLPGNNILSRAEGGPYRTAVAGYGGLFDNGGDIVGYESPGGYFLFRPKRYIAYFSAIAGPDSPLLSLANVRYLLTSPPFITPSDQPVPIRATQNRIALPSGPVPPSGYSLVDSSLFNWYRLYRNNKALPRYYFSSGVQVVPDEHERLRLLDNSAFVAGRATILENNPPGNVDNCTSQAVEVRSYTPTSVRLSANSPGKCLLVASDSYDPGWKAYSDGKQVPIYPANEVFRAVYLSPGTHMIEMRYEPRPFRLGLGISITSLLILLCAFLLFSRKIDQFLDTLAQADAGVGGVVAGSRLK